MSAPESAETVCWVCWGPTRRGDRCARCAWPPPRPGLTDHHDAARAFDHAAAVRVAWARGLSEVPAEVRELVRHGPVPAEHPMPTEIVAPARGTHAAVTLLGALVARELNLLLFLEIGTRYLSTQWVRLDRHGFVDVTAGHWGRQEWERVVPWLPTDPAVRDLTLAGGVGKRPALGDPERPAPLVATACDALRGHFAANLAELREAAVSDARQARALVLVERRPDWSWCAFAADAVRAVVPPTAVLRGGAFADESVELPTLIERLALETPTRHAIRLVGAGSDAPVDPSVDVLLPAGAVPGAAGLPFARITVALPGSDPRGAELAVVAGTSANAVPFDRSTVHTAPGEATFAVRMPAPGRVEFTWVAGAAGILGLPEPPAPARVPAPTGSPPPVPRPWWPRAGAVGDVLCAVELGGSAAETSARLAFVREVVAEAARPGPGGAWGRVGVLGYRDLPDRDPQPWRDIPEAVVAVDFTTPAAALSALADWTHDRVVDPSATTLERVCALLRGDELGWDPVLPTLVLTVGRRGPHPYVQGLDPAPAHPGTRWDQDLAAGRALHRLRHILVTDHPGLVHTLGEHARERTLTAWRLLGADGCFTLDRVSPKHVLRFGADIVAGRARNPLLLDVIRRPGRTAEPGRGGR